MVSEIDLGVTAFLAAVAIWLFWQKGEVRDRTFLAVASVIYMSIIFTTIWKFGRGKEDELAASLLLEITGFLLVGFSKRMKEKSK